MTIRSYQGKDAGPLADLFRRSVEAIGPRDYTAEQVAAWLALAPSPAQVAARCADGRTALVAVDAADRPLAFGDLEADGHIAYRYCAPEAAGTGIVAALYDQLEAEARQRGIGSLSSEASEAARRFFLKQGFTIVARRDFAIGGVAIHNYSVKKIL